jgi:hypothetical protein
VSRPRNCELSAALERKVDAPADMFVSIGASGIWWAVTDVLDAAEVTALDVALTRHLDAGYTGITRDGLAGRIDGVPFRVTYAAQVAPGANRHLAVVR